MSWEFDPNEQFIRATARRVCLNSLNGNCTKWVCDHVDCGNDPVEVESRIKRAIYDYRATLRESRSEEMWQLAD